jgi:hypothetical protein
MKIVREHIIFEKFTDDESDPIVDMGIGGYSFETLKPGAIIKAKRLGIAVTKRGNGHFTSYHSGSILSPTMHILITNIKDFNPPYKVINFIKYYDKENLDVARETMKNGIQIPYSYYGTHNKMIVSKKMFDNRFEIIERGF